MEIGVYTFAELNDQDPAGRMRDLLEEVGLAEQVGLDVFGVGEHHRPDFVVSAPAVVLGAAAVRTERIRLTSAVTVLSSDDPVRVFQEFATLDLLSGGRAEIMAARGSFIESFPLFGYDLADYDELFAEMMNAIGRERGWSGIHRQDYDALRTRRGALVVGSPQEVIEKILFQHEIFAHDRFLGQTSVGTMPHDKVMRAIELLGTEVAPVVRAEVARRTSSVAPMGRPT